MPATPPGTEAPVALPLQRLGAALGDGILVGFPGLVVSGLGGDEWVRVVIFTVYTVVGTAVWGRTLGKAFVGIRVVALGTDEPPGWWRAAVRWAVPAASWIFVGISGGIGFAARLVPLVVYAPILWDPLRRGWHDRIAGTVVVEAG